VTAANNIVKLMFNSDMTLQSTFTTDYAWAKLFGQTIPIGDDDNITSGRMITDTTDLADVCAPLGQAIAALIGTVRDCVYQVCSSQTYSPIIVRATSSSVLTRPVGRLSAQRIHVDGTSAHAGRGHEVSCLIALVQQRTVAFIETHCDCDNIQTGESAISTTLCLVLRQGRYSCSTTPSHLI